MPSAAAAVPGIRPQPHLVTGITTIWAEHEEENGAALGDVDPTKRSAVYNEAEQRILGLSTEPLPMALTP
ncbi:unnamed protein product [Gadus morhua 'NCC']